MTSPPDAAATLALRAARPRAERIRAASSGDEVVSFRDARNVHWRVRADWLDRLAGRAAVERGDGLPVYDWIAAPTTTVVKHGPHRSVYRLSLDGAVVYLKHDRVLRWTDVVRRMLKPSPSKREWVNAELLARRGVPTIRPIAFGETIRGGLVRDSFFVSVEIPHCEQLDAYLARSLGRRSSESERARRGELVDALADLCARCHDAGVDHQDFHAGNVLVQTPPSEAGPPRLFLIDLPAVAFRAPLGWPATRDSLAMLNTGLRDLTHARERARFLMSYFAKREKLGPPDFATAADEISARTWALAQANFHSRDKRAVRRNQDFQPHRFSHGAAYAVVDARRAEAATVVAEAGSRESESPSWSPVEMELGGRRRRVACKTYDDPTRALSWRRFWKWTPGLRRWVIGHALLARGIATPRPWIVARPKRGPSAGRITVACEWIENAATLDEALTAIERLDEPRRRASLDALARSVGRLLGDLHRWGATHRDLDASSVLVSWSSSASSEARRVPRVHLVNLDRLRLGRREDAGLALTDLRRLLDSVTIRRTLDARATRRFLAAYLSTFRLSVVERRARLARLEAAISWRAIGDARSDA